MEKCIKSPPEHNILMQAFKCVIGDSTATYVSGPITTGRRFIDWYIEFGHELEVDDKAYQGNKRENVISRNESDIVKMADSIRKNCATPVIEPASLCIHTWAQKDYYRFWTELMRLFVSRVVVIEGWQYSIGCVIEFLYAVHSGILVETVDGIPINEVDGRKLIADAADDIMLRGASLERLMLMAQALREHTLIDGDSSDQ